MANRVRGPRGLSVLALATGLTGATGCAHHSAPDPAAQARAIAISQLSRFQAPTGWTWGSLWSIPSAYTRTIADGADVVRAYWLTLHEQPMA